MPLSGLPSHPSACHLVTLSPCHLVSPRQPMKLDGRTTLVTGGARNIGRAIALRLAAEGARVIVADVRDEEGRAVVAEIGAAGGEARFVRCDVRREEDAMAAVTAAMEAWGGLDVLVNN